MCRGCASHHVSPLVWRYALVLIGARRDATGRYVVGVPGRRTDPSDAVRRFLQTHGPASVDALATWAGLARPHARRLWDGVAGELAAVRLAGRQAFLLEDDLPDLAGSPPLPELLVLPPGDPFLETSNRPLVVPDPALRTRAFRPVQSPGVVLVDGSLVALWRARGRGRRTVVAVERLAPFDPALLLAWAERMAALRGAAGVEVLVA